MFRTIFSVAAVLIAGCIFFFYTKPAYDGLQSLSAQSAQYDAALAKAAQLQALKQSLLSKYNSFDPTAISRLTTMLPDQVDNIRLILDLDNMAALYGMGLENVTVSNPSDNGSDETAVGAISSAQEPYSSISLTFSTAGTYDQFKQFLAALQSSLRLVDITSLTLSSGSSAALTPGQAPSEPVYNYNITINTYWLR